MYAVVLVIVAKSKGPNRRLQGGRAAEPEKPKTYSNCTQRRVDNGTNIVSVSPNNIILESATENNCYRLIFDEKETELSLWSKQEMCGTYESSSTAELRQQETKRSLRRQKGHAAEC